MLRSLIVGLFLLAAPTGQSPTWQAMAPEPPTFAQGVWENPELGHVIDVSPDGVRVFHHDGDRCVPDTDLVPAYSLAARGPNGGLLLQYYDYRAFDGLMQISLRFERLAALPAACTAPPRAGNAEVFDALWNAFDQRNAFFAVRGVDWQASRDRYRPRALAAISDDALFDVLSEMLGELGDGHVNLSLGDRYYNAGRSGLRDRLDKAWIASGDTGTAGAYRGAWHRAVQQTVPPLLDPGSHRTGADGALEWGMIGGKVGYVRINRFNSFAPSPAARPEQFAALQRDLVRMKQDLAPAARLIVDVALNGGGSDAAALMIAQAFADRPRQALSYRVGGRPPQALVVAPTFGRERRPILLITSEVTASAAESFVLMMRAFPHVTQVGEPTRGILSSLLPRPLPNGFQVTLAYEGVLDSHGVSYEGKGIPPARRLDLFPDDDLRGGFARVLAELAK